MPGITSQTFFAMCCVTRDMCHMSFTVSNLWGAGRKKNAAGAQAGGPAAPNLPALLECYGEECNSAIQFKYTE